MKLNICVLGSSFSWRFVLSLLKLTIDLNEKDIEWNWCNAQNANIYKGRDMVLQGEIFGKEDMKLFSGDPYDYILWIDSDQVFEPGDVHKLIKADKQVIGGAIRQADMVYACGEWDEKLLKEDKTTRRLDQKILDKSEEPIRVGFTGFGFILIKQGVYEQLKYPWHKALEYDIDGVFDQLSEDGSFFKQLRQLDIPVYIHPKVRIGHEKTFVIPG